MKLSIGHLSTAYHTSLVLIGKKEWGKNAGLDLNWELYPTGPKIIEALGRGELDLGYVGLPPAIIGVAEGAELKCVAGGHVEGTVMVAGVEHRSLVEMRYDTKKTLEQFNVVGSPSKGSIHDVIIRALLKKEGLTGRVAVKNYPWADLLLEALETGEIDAALGTPALAVVAEQGRIGRMIFKPKELWPFNPSYGIVVREGFLDEFQKSVEGFLHLHRKASALIRGDPYKAARIISEVIGVVDEDFVLRVLGVSPRYCTSLPDEYAGATMAFVKAMMDLEYTRNPLREEDIFDRSLIEKLHPEAHHY